MVKKKNHVFETVGLKTGGAIPAEIAKLEGKNAAGATIGFVNGEFLALIFLTTLLFRGVICRGKFGRPFQGKPAATGSPTGHAWFFSVSIIRRTLTWTS